MTVLGGRPAGSPGAADGVAFVAQDTPLYQNLPAADMLHLTANLNRRFDQWIEGGWLLALSALLIAATIWLVRRRAA